MSKSRTVGFPGLEQVRADLAKLPEAVQARVGEAMADLAGEIADACRDAGYASSEQSRAAAGSVRVVPGVGLAAGGPGYGAARASAGQLFFGAEFGARTARQFVEYAGGPMRRHAGTNGYWFYPTVRERADGLAEAMAEIVEEAASG